MNTVNIGTQTSLRHEHKVAHGMLCYLIHTGALPIPRYSYSNGSDVIIADFVQCNGSESDLLNCNVNFKSGDNFDEGFLVGVRCDGMLY